MIHKDKQYDIKTPQSVRKETFIVEETFLFSTGDKIENFIRKVGKNDSFSYVHEIRNF
jgi:hypothetical protein